ncbi:hypothetical protein HDG42_006691 [Paraburkholderia sp. JPY171]|nr:hypothetical protein [Paraburkholderia atlantica]
MLISCRRNFRQPADTESSTFSLQINDMTVRFHVTHVTATILFDSLAVGAPKATPKSSSFRVKPVSRLTPRKLGTLGQKASTNRTSFA